MDIVIIGAGGHGRVVLEILRAAGVHRVIGFIDADPLLVGTRILGVDVLGPINLLSRLKQQKKIKGAIVGVGDNRARQELGRVVIQAGLECVSAIHPKACVAPSATVGAGAVVCAGAVVGTEARVSDLVIVNTGAVVDHECEIGEAAHICPTAALAGRVKVGAGAFIGLGAKVIQCLTIGDHATVGAGAVVIRDVGPNVTVVGAPARVLSGSRNPKLSLANN